MFTGIVTSLGEVRSVKPRADNLHRITIACDYPRAGIDQGASIACSGVCLTVVDTGEEGGRTWFAVDAAAETLRVTTVGRWRQGSKINLERALKFGDELGGSDDVDVVPHRNHAGRACVHYFLGERAEGADLAVGVACRWVGGGCGRRCG